MGGRSPGSEGKGAGRSRADAGRNIRSRPPAFARIVRVKIEWRGKFRLLDFVPLLAFSAVGVFNPSIEFSRIVVLLLLALGVVQVLEPFTGYLISVTAKLALCYGLVYYTNGISSSFSFFLLLPLSPPAINFAPLDPSILSSFPP